MFNFEELDEITRSNMLEEFKRELAINPYISPRLNQEGKRAFPSLIKAAIRSGNEVSLAESLSDPRFWKSRETYYRSGRRHQRRINPRKAAEFLADTEFNTWYVRGLAKRLLDEGVSECQVYRAASAWEPRGECLIHEGQSYPVQEIYDGHRARYWPKPGNPEALSIPVGTNCHHSIRRLPD